MDQIPFLLYWKAVYGSTDERLQFPGTVDLTQYFTSFSDLKRLNIYSDSVTDECSDPQQIRNTCRLKTLNWEFCWVNLTIPQEITKEVRMDNGSSHLEGPRPWVFLSSTQNMLQAT